MNWAQISWIWHVNKTNKKQTKKKSEKVEKKKVKQHILCRNKKHGTEISAFTACFNFVEQKQMTPVNVKLTVQEEILFFSEKEIHWAFQQIPDMQALPAFPGTSRSHDFVSSLLLYPHCGLYCWRHVQKQICVINDSHSGTSQGTLKLSNDGLKIITKRCSVRVH